jgi:hypothetical protein
MDYLQQLPCLSLGLFLGDMTEDKSQSEPQEKLADSSIDRHCLPVLRQDFPHHTIGQASNPLLLIIHGSSHCQQKLVMWDKTLLRDASLIGCHECSHIP